MERAPRPGTNLTTDPQSVKDLIAIDMHNNAQVPIYDPATKKTSARDLTPDELEMLVENQYEVRAELKRRREAPGFLPSEKKIDPLTGRPEREDYESPFEGERAIQYSRSDGRVRRAVEWNEEDSDGELMDFGHQHMDQEYIVTLGHKGKTGAVTQEYYIFGYRVYDLTAAKAAAKDPATGEALDVDFRDFETSLPLQHDIIGDDGEVMPKRGLGKFIPKGHIGKPWLNEKGWPIFPDDGTGDPNDPIVMKKVVVRGGIQAAPISTADRPHRGDDPFEAIDELLPIETRTLPRQTPEIRSDHRRRTSIPRVMARWLMNRSDETLDEDRYSHDGTRVGERPGHEMGRAEWERMEIRQRRDEALQRVHIMIGALAQVSTPEIESEIEITDTVLPGHPKIARMFGVRQTAVDAAQVASGQAHPDKNADRSRGYDRCKGWVIPFYFEGDQISIKTTDPNANRDADLIIEKPEPGKKARSWRGGIETFLPGVAPRGRRETPIMMTVGPGMGSLEDYGDHAIERATRSDKPEGDNTDVELTRLINIGNILYELGQRAAGPGAPNRIDGIIDPMLRPAAFGR